MTQPVSQDPRRRIVQAVAAGSSIRKAAARFEVSPSTAIKLMQRVRATGSTRPAKMGGYRRPLLDGHDDLLCALTGAEPGITLVEIKAAFAERDIVARQMGIVTDLESGHARRCLRAAYAYSSRK